MSGRVFKDQGHVGEGTKKKRTSSRQGGAAEAGQGEAAPAQVTLPSGPTQAGGARCEGPSGQMHSDGV